MHSTVNSFMLNRPSTLKRKCRHFDEIFVTGGTESCHFDNFRCSQWWKFHQNDDISVSVNITLRLDVAKTLMWCRADCHIANRLKMFSLNSAASKHKISWLNVLNVNFLNYLLCNVWGYVFSCWTLLFWWLWEYFYFILLSLSSNRKYLI